MRFILAAAIAALATPSFAMTLTSPDVTDGATFDAKFVCAKFGGQSLSPALAWATCRPAPRASPLPCSIPMPRCPVASGIGSPSTFR